MEVAKLRIIQKPQCSKCLTKNIVWSSNIAGFHFYVNHAIILLSLQKENSSISEMSTIIIWEAKYNVNSLNPQIELLHWNAARLYQKKKDLFG